MQLGMVVRCLLAASEDSKKGKTCQRHDSITGNILIKEKMIRDARFLSVSHFLSPLNCAC